MISLRGFNEAELTNGMHGYEKLIELLSSEIKNNNAYTVVNPYNDILLAERGYMIDECYLPIIKEVSSRTKNPVQNKFTGYIPFNAEKFAKYMEDKEKKKAEVAVKTIVEDTVSKVAEAVTGMSTKE